MKQGLELFEGIVFVLFLSLVRRETGVGAIRENGLCHRSLVKQASGSPAQQLLPLVLGKSKEYQSESGRLLEPSRNPKNTLKKT